MAQNHRFGLSVRILAALAEAPGTMLTSAVLAQRLKTGPVAVRRLFGALHRAGFVAQRKGPQGGARLKVAAKTIGLGDVYEAVMPAWPGAGDKATDAAIRRARQDARAAMNETSIAAVVKKMRKG